MCRMLGYIGGPLRLSELVQKPPNSLYVQSYRPREMTSGTVNADSWGTALWLFRNRYERGFRDIPSGLRCAGGL